jgi:hypothetical protein
MRGKMLLGQDIALRGVFVSPVLPILKRALEPLADSLIVFLDRIGRLLTFQLDFQFSPRGLCRPLVGTAGKEAQPGEFGICLPRTSCTKPRIEIRRSLSGSWRLRLLRERPVPSAAAAARPGRCRRASTAGGLAQARCAPGDVDVDRRVRILEPN